MKDNQLLVEMIYCLHNEMNKEKPNLNKYQCRLAWEFLHKLDSLRLEITEALKSRGYKTPDSNSNQCDLIACVALALDKTIERNS